jgi:large subunit ribosomal protein L25
VADLALTAHSRSERGRHVQAIRRQGVVPAILYGRNLPAQAISTEIGALVRVWQRAGRTHLIDLSIDGARPRKVLFHDFQVDPRTARPLHADFFAVNLRERLAVDIPVRTVGESPAVTQLKVGSLQQVLATLRVEALPGNLPDHLAVDVSGLTEVDSAVRVREVVLPDGVILAGHIDPDEVVVKVAPLRVVAVEEAAPAAAEAEPTPAEEEAPEQG